MDEVKTPRPEGLRGEPHARARSPELPALRIAGGPDGGDRGGAGDSTGLEGRQYCCLT